MNPQLWWYLSRATAIVAYLFLTASVLWGVALASGAFAPQRRPWLLDLHRWLGGLTLAALAGHLIALVGDSSVEFTPAELLIPLASDWRPWAVALGVIALWTLLAIQLTSLARRRLPRRAWRAVHLLSYAVFWLVSLHGALAGTDSSRPAYVTTAALVVGLVAVALCYRIVTRGRRQHRRDMPTREPRADADLAAGAS